MNKLFLSTLASILFCSSVWAELDLRAEHEITIICEQLLADYAIYRDHLEAENFANIFTQDAHFVPGSGLVRGRENIKKYIEDHATPAHLIMFTSSQIDAQSETRASGLAYAVILNGDRQVLEGDRPIQMNGITAASEYRAEFERTEEGWKISKLELKGLFRGPGAVQQ
jgi:hypothetical protein|tara:strand:+ start:613 stop:1119 length:507 start_codon:yes stop_codon:yes gene_type:complete